MNIESGCREPELRISMTVEGVNQFLHIQFGAPFHKDVQPRELKLAGVLTTDACELVSVADEVAVQVDAIDGKNYWTVTFDLLVPAEQESQIIRVAIGKRFTAKPVIHVLFFAGAELYRKCDCILA